MNEPADTHELTAADVRGIIRTHGLRATRQREDLYAALAASKSHPSADELFGSVRMVQPGLSLATVYNTLEAFASAGLCRKIPSAGATRYDACTHEHVHVKTDDGRVFDVPDDLGKALLGAIGADAIRQVEQELGVTISGVNIELRGRAQS